MSKFKPHKGLLKRVRVTGKGKVKFKAAYSGHLRSGKTGTRVQALRKRHVAKVGNLPAMEQMLGQRLIPG